MIGSIFLASCIALLGVVAMFVQMGATRARRRAHELGERERR